MYRPTVRYNDCFKDYVNEVYQVTSLDRNQIIRLALFLLPHTEEGKAVLKHYLKEVGEPPLPRWDLDKKSMVEWYGMECDFEFVSREDVTSEGGTSDDNEESLPRSEGETTRHDVRTVYPQAEEKKNGIVARIGDHTTILYTG